MEVDGRPSGEWRFGVVVCEIVFIMRVGGRVRLRLDVAVCTDRQTETDTHSDVTKACSLMVVRTSQNLILVVRVCP